MEQLIPKLRFPEFSGEWEKKFLKNILTIGNGKDYKHLKTGEIPVYGTGGVMTYVDKYLLDTLSVGIGRKGTINRPILLEPPFWTVDTLFYTYNYVKSDTYFVYYLFNRINWLKYNEASGVPSLSKTTINSIKITIPSLPEQQKIADYLSTIDKKLELLREKREQLECYKKGMMQQLFSQQIRFKDDSGKDYPDWQEKRLGEILYKGSSVKCTNIDETKILTVRLHQKGVVKSTNTQNLSIGSTTYFVRKKGQFIYGKQNIFNGAFGIIPNYYDGFLTSADIPALTIKKECLDAFFFVAFLRSYNRYKRIENIAIGTGSKRVHENEFLKLKINLPSLPEQQKIAEFLSALDTKIEGIANQIEQTEAFKKAMLQQLFV